MGREVEVKVSYLVRVETGTSLIDKPYCTSCLPLTFFLREGSGPG